MSTITKPMALDESFNTTESTPRNQADVLAAIEDAIRQGFGQVALAVEYDNTDSGLTAENVQDAIDEVDDTVDGLANDVAEISSDIESTQTATGNLLTLTDCAPINAESLKVELEPKQDLHGQSAPYVGGAGKNKLPMTVASLKAANTGGTWNGNVFTHNNGVTFTVLTDSDGNVTGIKANGTASAQTLFIIAMSFSLTYESIINGCPANGSNSTYMLVAQPNADTGSGYTIPANDARNIYINIASGYTASNLMFYPMIRLATESDSTFAPYTNICPITGYTECGVDDVGKNKFDETNYYDLYTNYEYTENTYRCKKIQLKANTTYTITQRATVTSNVVLLLNIDIHVNGTGYFDCRKAGDSKTYTTGEDGYLYIGTLGNDADTNARLKECKIQIEEGSTATAYEPYHSSNATIQFGQTVYGADVDFSGGTESTHAVTTIAEMAAGSHITRETASGRVRYVITIAGMKKQTVRTMADLYSEQYVTISDGRSYSNCPDYCIFNRPEGGVFINDQRYESVSDFVAANGDIKICYPLETANTLSTPPTPLKMLKGTNNLSADGVMQIGYQPDNVIGEVKEKADKINYSEIVKYTISGNTAETIPLVIDGTAHNDIPIVTDITKYRMLCVELVLKPSTAITGVYFSAIAFTDGIYLPSGISIPVYIPSEKFYANITINPDGNGGFKLSYVAINQSQSTPPDYYAIRVRAFNQY